MTRILSDRVLNALRVSIFATLVFPMTAHASWAHFSSACRLAYGLEAPFETIQMYPPYRSTDLEQNVAYLKTSEERARHRLEIVNGEFYWSDGTRLGRPTSNYERVIFVMDVIGDFYAWNPSVEQTGPISIHHSTFLAGGEVAVAGTLLFSGGRLKRVDTVSGHYKIPDQMLVQAKTSLKQKGIDVEAVLFAGLRGQSVDVSNPILTPRTLSEILDRRIEGLLEKSARYVRDENTIADLQSALELAVASKPDKISKVVQNIWRVLKPAEVENIFLSGAYDRVRSLIEVGRPPGRPAQQPIDVPARPKGLLQRLFQR